MKSLSNQKKQKILVLGAGGYLGSQLMEYSAKKELSSAYTFFWCFRKQVTQDSENSFSFDVKNQDILISTLNNVKPDYIINLVGLTHGADYTSFYELNAEFSRQLFEAVLSANILVKNILLIGSAAEYGNNISIPLKETDRLMPCGLYGLSKVLQTNYFKYYTANTTINATLARTFNLIGSDMPKNLSIGAFVDKINKCKNDDSIEVGNLLAKRDYLYIEDALHAFMTLLINGKSGEVYNVCSGKAVTMQEILDGLIVASGKKIKIVIDETLFRPNDILISVGSNQKIKTQLQWAPKTDLALVYSELVQK